MAEHDLDIVAEGLQFPEGPVALPDGRILLVEIARGTLTMVEPSGRQNIVAELGGGPNGAAIGPDGACYVCNNGGFQWHEHHGRLYPREQAAGYGGGSIQRVEIESGRFETLYSECDGEPLRGPNDLVFDATGGFWFTDHGKQRGRERDRTGVFYAAADGSHIREVIFPLEGPNGIGLAPDGSELYVAETLTGRLWAFALSGPGELAGVARDRPDGGRLLAGPPGYYLLDSLAVTADGGICVATIIQGGITTFYPDARPAEFLALPDRVTTNICFGGEGLREAYITLSSTGRLLRRPWPVAGARLHYLND